MDRSRCPVSKTGLGLIRGGVETKIQAIYCFGYMVHGGSYAPLCTLIQTVLDCASGIHIIGCSRVPYRLLLSYERMKCTFLCTYIPTLDVPYEEGRGGGMGYNAILNDFK